MKISHLVVLPLLLLGQAGAQLFQTSAQTAAQGVLKGFKAQGNVLQSGSTRLTLDTAGGRVYGVLIEAQKPADLARGIAAAWGSSEKEVTRLAEVLSKPDIVQSARAGFMDYTDDDQRDLLALKLTGTGNAAQWRAYVAVKIWPDSAFPATNNAMGAASAPNVIRIFSDFQCPYCQQLDQETLPTWQKNPNQYRVIHYHFPLSFHKNAFPAAEASECAAQQGKFWPYAEQLFSGLSDWKGLTGTALNSLFERYGSATGLNLTTFRQCVSTRATKAAVDAQIKAGGEVAVNGTPSVYLNGMKLADYTDPDEIKAVQDITGARPTALSVIESRLKALR